MPYVALLDANCLYGIAGCDLLLRLAEAGLFSIAWSERILDETFDALQRRGLPAEALERRRQAMEQAFPEAMIDGDRFEPSVPREIDAGDRHVVAAALAARADVIVSGNLRHFPPAALEPLGLAVQSLDDFLLRTSYRPNGCSRRSTSRLRT